MKDRAVDAKVWEALHIAETFEHATEFDLIHNHFDFLPLAFSRRSCATGRQGFLVHDIDTAVEAIGRVPRIARERCREEAERRFSAGRMVDDYLRLYQRVLCESEA
jgi:hypothetical protein